MNQKQIAINEKALKLASDYRRLEVELFEIISQVYEQKIYQLLEYGGLREYIVKHLNLSESAAKSYVTVVRKAHKVPRLRKAINTKEADFGKIVRISAYITKENVEEWITKTQTLSTQSLEAEARGKTYFVRLDEESYQDLKRLAEIEGRDLSEVVKSALKERLKKRDPLAKAERVLKAEGVLKAGSGHVDKAPKPLSPHAQAPNDKTPNDKAPNDNERQKRCISRERKHLPARVKHQVNQRDQARCTFINVKGERCENRSHLHFHHPHRKVDGGEDTLTNLRLLCYTHHDYVHQLELPI